MLERMKRRGFLKAALGGTVAVALGEMLGGKAEAAPEPYRCLSTNVACKDYCSASCKSQCNNIFTRGPRCASCDICDYDNCEAEANACGATCSMECSRACGRRRGEQSNCAQCEVCWPPAPPA